MNDFQQRFTTPCIDNALDGLEAYEAKQMALALLRRHVIISDKTGDYIGYHFARDAAADLIINTMHNAAIENGYTDLHLRRHVVDTFNTADQWVYENILTDGHSQRIIRSIKNIDMENIPLLNLPGFTVLDGIIMPETQQEWVVKHTFKHINLDQQIVDALYYDQNVIFILGKPEGEPVLIGDVLQNEVINIMFADMKLNILSANTYRLS